MASAALVGCSVGATIAVDVAIEKPHAVLTSGRSA
jgi:hypothetical protein